MIATCKFFFLTCLSFHPLPLFPTHSHSPFYSLIEYSWPACEVSLSVTGWSPKRCAAFCEAYPIFWRANVTHGQPWKIPNYYVSAIKIWGRHWICVMVYVLYIYHWSVCIEDLPFSLTYYYKKSWPDKTTIESTSRWMHNCKGIKCWLFIMVHLQIGIDCLNVWCILWYVHVHRLTWSKDASYVLCTSPFSLTHH